VHHQKQCVRKENSSVKKKHQNKTTPKEIDNICNNLPETTIMQFNQGQQQRRLSISKGDQNLPSTSKGEHNNNVQQE